MLKKAEKSSTIGKRPSSPSNSRWAYLAADTKLSRTEEKDASGDEESAEVPWELMDFSCEDKYDNKFPAILPEAKEKEGRESDAKFLIPGHKSVHTKHGLLREVFKRQQPQTSTLITECNFLTKEC